MIYFKSNNSIEDIMGHLLTGNDIPYFEFFEGLRDM